MHNFIFSPINILLSQPISLYCFFCLFVCLFVCFFMAVLGLRCCVRAFSSCGKWGPLFITVRRPFTIAAPPAAEHRLQTCRLSNCGSRSQLLRGMWDPPRPGLEPVSPALAGRFSTTAPPGKPSLYCFFPYFFAHFFLYLITALLRYNSHIICPFKVDNSIIFSMLRGV